jgi:hypothetical protein
MPVIDGKVVRSRFTSLSLKELSAVDRPAQPGALAVIMKRRSDTTEHTAEIMKYLEGDEGAKTFRSLFADAEQRAKYWASQEALWPVMNSVNESINSIVANQGLSASEKEGLIRQSVEDFLSAIRDKMPEVEAEIAKLLKAGGSGSDDNREHVMTEAEKIADLTANLDTASSALAVATKSLETVTAERDAAVAKAAKMPSNPETDMEEDGKPTKKGLEFIAKHRVEDEILKVGDIEVRKSAVGDAAFAMFKAQQVEIEKANDRAETAVLEKRAGDEFAHIPGTVAEKALVLKSIALMPDAAKASFETILKAAESMAAKGFNRIGHGGERPMDVTKAAGDFTSKVSEIKTRDNCTLAKAMSKARVEFPELHAAAYPAGAN